jgi:BMFP domain-containing protein YqiC
MLDAKQISELARQLAEALPPPLRAVQAEVGKSFEAVLAAQLHKLDLVTRSEFDAQARVLARTREKLEALEKRLNELG